MYNDDEKDNKDVKTYNREELFKIITEAIKPYDTLLRSVEPITEAMKSISESIPKFPKIRLPKIEIDYDKIEAIIEHNSSYGWTMTGEINTVVYMDEELLQLNEEELDDVFLKYYEENASENYQGLKMVLLDKIGEQWNDVLSDCFKLYEEDMFKVVIPTLISIVESEIASMLQTVSYGRWLFSEWEDQILNEEQKINLIISRSIHSYLKDNLFGRDEFKDERKRLNRHRVLHGRDDPRLWRKIDALKLFNLLSSLQFVKE